VTVLRQLRVYRFLRVSLVIAFTFLRYLWLLARERVRWLRPSEAAWERAHARTGRSIYRLATGLCGAYVKLGQIVGTRGDVFPEALVAPLRGLHDRVPARPLRKLRRHIERELGQPIDEVFAEISEEPIAAASLAQVHRARLRSGEDVVVKVQYPEARRLFPGDLANLRRASRVMRLLNRRLDLRALADELAEFVCLELDFAREARSTVRISGIFADDDAVRIPHLYDGFGSDRLLVLEFLDGVKITEVDLLRERGVDLRQLAEQVAGVYCAMIFEHGFFQGDPHPGNLMVLTDGTLGVLDFGLAKELPPGFADGVAEMIARAMAGDEEGVRVAAEAIGFRVGDDPGKLLELVRMLLGQGGSARRVLEVLDGGALDGVPSHFALIVRALVLLAGLSHSLVPGEKVIQGAMTRSLAPRLMAAAQRTAAQQS
jgi:ubiquinone biosynthesis protein